MNHVFNFLKEIMLSTDRQIVLDITCNSECKLAITKKNLKVLDGISIEFYEKFMAIDRSAC